jgi:hypothetical protein
VRRLQFPVSAGFKVQGAGFRAQGAGFRVQGAGFKVQGAGFRVQSAGFRVQGVGFKVTSLKVRGLGFRVFAQVFCYSTLLEKRVAPHPFNSRFGAARGRQLAFSSVRIGAAATRV